MRHLASLRGCSLNLLDHSLIHTEILGILWSVQILLMLSYLRMLYTMPLHTIHTLLNRIQMFRMSQILDCPPAAEEEIANSFDNQFHVTLPYLVSRDF